jgi:hypothetical protein
MKAPDQKSVRIFEIAPQPYSFPVDSTKQTGGNPGDYGSRFNILDDYATGTYHRIIPD